MKQYKTAEQQVETWADTILRLSYSYLKNTQDAQDICQTVLLRLLTSAPEFESQEHEKAWVLRVTANACKDLLRSPWRKRTCELDACAQFAAPEEPDSELLRTVQALPAKYRTVIHLYYYEGYSAQEVGEILGISANTVYTRLARARKKLKWELEENGYEWTK